MNVKNVLLTHFSACDYPKLPRDILAEPGEDTDEWQDPLVVAAFDLMEIDLDKMWKANLYLPAIGRCYRGLIPEGNRQLHQYLLKLVLKDPPRNYNNLPS